MGPSADVTNSFTLKDAMMGHVMDIYDFGLTLRKNSVPFSMICWICRKPAVYMRRNWSPTVMLRRPV